MDTAQWPQEIVVKPLEEIVTNTSGRQPPPPQVASQRPPSGIGVVERKARPQKDQALNCPRCNSTNTKFCYYNNYSLTQPRYFCKACRRYWTEGGSLRNIPVGGGSRKNKRSSSSSSSASSLSSPSCNNNSNASSSPAKTHLPDHLIMNPSLQSTAGLTGQNPKFHEAQDLNLAFPQGFLVQPPPNGPENKSNLPVLPSSATTNSTSAAVATTCAASDQLSALELLTGIPSSRGLSSDSSFMSLPTVQDPIASSTVYTTSGFSIPMPEFRPSLGFSLDQGFGGGLHLGGVQEDQTSNGRLLFPFEDLKLPVSSSSAGDIDQNNKEHAGDNSAGYWTGMLGGGSWQL